MFFAGCDKRVSTDPSPDLRVAVNLRSILEQAGEGDESGGDLLSDAEPTGFATLQGRFVLSGIAPDNPPVNVTKDLDICGASATDQQLLVSSDGGIKNVLIFVERIPDVWVHESAQPGKTDDFIFDQKQCVFLTRVAAFQVSQPLKILNSDPKGHNTDISPRFSAAFNQTIPAGGFALYRAEEEEKDPVSVKCSIHPWMQAWMIPRKNSYFSVTNDEGNFEIPNLPAGVDVSLRAWHERTKYIQNVSLNDQPEKWSKGRFQQNLDPDSVVDLQVTIAASEFE